MKLDVLAIAAHPDDTELCCGGTLAALSRSGKKVGVLDLTQGEMGTRGSSEQRRLEAQTAAGILGLAARENAKLPDCGLINDPQQRESVIRIVRQYQPDICLINALEDRHPDHRNAARLTLDALFYAGLHKLETRNENGERQLPWRPHHILHYMQHWPFQPTFVFDITETIDIKEEAIRAFATQFDSDENDDEPETYVSGKRFFNALRGRAMEYGQQIGVPYGEPFLYHGGPIPVSSLDFLFNARPVR